MVHLSFSFPWSNLLTILPRLDLDLSPRKGHSLVFIYNKLYMYIYRLRLFFLSLF